MSAKIGNFPFPANEKKPMLIKKEQAFVLPASGSPLGTPYFSNLSHLFVSTDKLHFGIFTVAPGSKYLPESVHIGDEVYWILKGTITQLNPETGQVTEAREGDVVWQPAGAWHFGYNFTNEECVLLYAIAPEIYGKGVTHAPKFPTKHKLFKSE